MVWVTVFKTRINLDKIVSYAVYSRGSGTDKYYYIEFVSDEGIKLEVGHYGDPDSLEKELERVDSKIVEI